MNNFFLYRCDYKEGIKAISATVIFCDKQTINENILQSEIRRFYEEHYQTDRIFIIAPDFLAKEIQAIFIDRLDETFIGIPRRQQTSLRAGLFLLLFDKKGSLTCDKPIPEGFKNKHLNEGLQNIFIKRGGLVTSAGAHHFVFPSGKHCDKFLRTGNILLYSSEIYFIAYAILGHYDETKISQIYCDTSSINSIAFALVELKNRFLSHEERKSISIESFSSYEGLYRNPVPYSANALLLISASTSANIIGYILDKQKLIDRDNILILYFLGDDLKLANIKDQLICNLNFTSENANGIPVYKTYNGEECSLCKKGSYPVKVAGDVFLLEKPHINRVLLTVRDAEQYLSGFAKEYMSKGNSEHVLKVNYKEGANAKYEVYIDFYEILQGLKAKNRFFNFKDKLKDYINQYIPSNARYLVALNDQASIDFADYILAEIKKNYKKGQLPKRLKQDELHLIRKGTEGSVIVIGSCISNGKNLLYISRALRKFDELKIVYFIGISRTKNSKYLSRLKSNLKQGKYGGETNSFLEVQTIYCDNSSKNTTWLQEINFLTKFMDYLRKKEHLPVKTLSFLEKRKKTLMASQGDSKRGLANELFYPRWEKKVYKQLELRKNFAFFKFDGYDGHVSQGDVYFTISNILNTLRNRDPEIGKDGNPISSLQQSAFVRNLLDPGNFDRFNDGIIQASLLRGACAEELAYQIEPDLSLEMFGTFETLIKYHLQDQGEALIEFLYALASQKMSLLPNHLQDIIQLVKTQCDEELMVLIAEYINYVWFELPKEKKEAWEIELKQGISTSVLSEPASMF